ncbi:MAG TPA: glycosyltransferase family 4 protein [Acidimicrobiales bacterium]
MRLLFAVQRFGHEVAGGAESFGRELATRMAGRGHDVHVVTSCARSYVDWADEYPPGESQFDGVTLHRLPVVRPRDNDLFNMLNVRVNAGDRPTPLYLQEEWMRLQGPVLQGYEAWLDERAGEFDAAAFVTYLYWTSWAGIPVAASQTPTIFHPLAHDEPPLYLPLYDASYRHASAFAFLTPEEAELVERRFRVRRPSIVLGAGVELDATGDAARFRAAHRLGDDPYLLFVGRIDPHKGSDELFDHFRAYKELHPGPLKLVFVGEPVRPLPPHPDVVVTGFVDDAVRVDAMAGALALAVPSYFESFSIVLVEAWAQGVPALVQSRCDVLRGQARRSNGAIPYGGFAEFEAAVDALVHDEPLRTALGEAGRAYVNDLYAWPRVLDVYEEFVTGIAARRRDIA